MNGAYWADIGTPEEYVRATADALAGRVHLRGSRSRGIAGDAHLGDDVHIEGDVRIGTGARLGARVRVVGPSVVGDGVTVGDDARLERAIVWDAAAIGARAQLTDAVVGIDYKVAADALLRQAPGHIAATITEALSHLFPAARRARVLDALVTKERSATFRAVPGTAAGRPGPLTNTPGVVLAGAWTDTGWPATMEGAVRSGHAAARSALVAAAMTRRLPQEVA